MRTGVHDSARRRALALSVACVGFPLLALARRARATTATVRRLAFEHTHTREQLVIAYAVGDSYSADALARIDWLLQDFRNDATHVAISLRAGGVGFYPQSQFVHIDTGRIRRW